MPPKRISGSKDTLLDGAPRIDIASSFRTVDASGSVHEADTGTQNGSLETTIATRVSQEGKSGTQSI